MTAISRTLSEIRASATKAVRGAGCDWGMAEEAGLAVRVLESHGLPGVRVLAGLLGGRPDCRTGQAHGARCGICAMTALSDRLPSLPEDGMSDDPLAGPLLLAVPLILMARAHGESYTLRWADAVLHCAPQGVAADGDITRAVAPGVTLHAAQDSPAAPRAPDWRSRAVAEADWTVLERFAARTLVPETAASRAAGAGPADAAPD